MEIHQDGLLVKGKIDDRVTTLRAIDSSSPELLERIRTEAGYLDRNTQRMRCPTFPRATPLRRLRRYRSQLQNDPRFALQAIRHVLECPRSQLLSSLSAAANSTHDSRVTGLLEKRPEFHFYIAHPYGHWDEECDGDSLYQVVPQTQLRRRNTF
jgi:hypothetical protein